MFLSCTKIPLSFVYAHVRFPQLRVYEIEAARAVDKCKYFIVFAFVFAFVFNFVFLCLREFCFLIKCSALCQRRHKVCILCSLLKLAGLLAFDAANVASRNVATPTAVVGGYP